MRSKSPWRFEDTFSLPVVVDGEGRIVAEVRQKSLYRETIDNGTLIAAADKLLEASADLYEDVRKLNIETKATVKLQALLLEVTGDQRYRKA